MKPILDQFVLLCYCTVSLLLTAVDITFVASFLLAIIYISINYFVDSKYCSFFTTLLFLILSFLVTDMFMFYPILFYHLVRCKGYLFVPFPFIAAFWQASEIPFYLCLFMLFGVLLSFYLQIHTTTYQSLEQKYTRTRDDGTEKELLLKEKNNALIEKQDSEIYAATLKERNRIAREIHDNVGHMLSRSILLVGAMKVMNKDTSLSVSFSQLEDTLHTAMTNVRESVHDLHDHSIDLKDALNGLINTFTFCSAQLNYDMGYEVPRAVKYTFITIIKEALNNIIKHSNATSVHIMAREHPGLYQLSIEDNGTLKPSAKKETLTGLGIINMDDRVRSLHGTFQIKSDEGFRIFITIPKKEILS